MSIYLIFVTMIHGKRYRLQYTKDTGYNYNIRVKAYIITGTCQKIWSTQAVLEASFRLKFWILNFSIYLRIFTNTETT